MLSSLFIFVIAFAMDASLNNTQNILNERPTQRIYEEHEIEKPSKKEILTVEKLQVANKQMISHNDILANIYESPTEANERITMLERLNGTCLGACIRCYDGVAACFWHVAEPAVKTLGVLSLGSAAILTVLIPIVEDPMIKNYCAVGTVITGALGGILLKTGYKFAGQERKEHIENYLALQDKK